MHGRDPDVLMDSNLAFSARQLKYEAGSRRLCAFYGENRPIGSLGDSGFDPIWAVRGSTPVAFLSLRKDRVTSASVLSGVARVERSIRRIGFAVQTRSAAQG